MPSHSFKANEIQEEIKLVYFKCFLFFQQFSDFQLSQIVYEKVILCRKLLKGIVQTFSYLYGIYHLTEKKKY